MESSERTPYSFEELDLAASEAAPSVDADDTVLFPLDEELEAAVVPLTVLAVLPLADL